MNGEIAAYLQGLLEHSRECQSTDCPSCRKLDEIFDVVKNRIFSSLVYTKIAVAHARAR
jgi:hypothetical protein